MHGQQNIKKSIYACVSDILFLSGTVPAFPTKTLGTPAVLICPMHTSNLILGRNTHYDLSRYLIFADFIFGPIICLTPFSQTPPLYP